MLAAIGALQQKGGIVNRQRNRFCDGAVAKTFRR